ncbi:MAG: CBS domain-containing protein [Candidatus Methanomethylicaceae archaeon]|jgi:CBS domain-containing protein
MKVRDVMNQNVIYAEVPGSREQVLNMLKERKISGMPVVKKGTKKLIGIITREDLFKHPDEDQLALIMNTNVVTTGPEVPFEDCIKIMVEKRYRRLPVIENDELLGIITVGDVVHKVIVKSNSNQKVKDFMKASVFSCWMDTPVHIASAMMHLANEYVTLVIDNELKIAGIVSNTDLMKISEVKIEETKSILKSGSESQEWDWETSSVLYITKGKIALPNTPIYKVMAAPCITINENASIIECAIQMQKFDIDQLPVTNAKEDVIGIIFDIDLLKSL